MIDAHAHEAVIRGEIVDAVRDRFADGVGREVVDVHQLRITLRLPLTSAVLEVANQLLLLRVDGDHRYAAIDAVLRLGVDVLELRVPIRMLRALDRLVRRLKAVPVIAQQLAHRLVADPDAVLREQLGSQHRRALARPSQGRLWVPAGNRVYELLQRWPHLWMRRFVGSLAGTPTNLDDVLGPRTFACFVPTLANRADRHPGSPCDRRHAAMADRTGLRASPEPTSTLVHGRLQQAPLLAYRLLRVHIERRSR